MLRETEVSRSTLSTVRELSCPDSSFAYSLISILMAFQYAEKALGTA